MDEVIDLNAERNRRERPDSEHIRKDDYGRELFRFLMSYDHDGGTWGTELWAYDHADAEAKAASMRGSLRVDGLCYTTVSV